MCGFSGATSARTNSQMMSIRCWQHACASPRALRDMAASCFSLAEGRDAACARVSTRTCCGTRCRQVRSTEAMAPRMAPREQRGHANEGKMDGRNASDRDGGYRARVHTLDTRRSGTLVVCGPSPDYRSGGIVGRGGEAEREDAGLAESVGTDYASHGSVPCRRTSWLLADRRCLSGFRRHRLLGARRGTTRRSRRQSPPHGGPERGCCEASSRAVGGEREGIRRRSGFHE